MGKQVKVYDTGQVYEIDSDLIYVPNFDRKEDKDEKREIPLPSK